ncbi:MAG: hypothetical protein PUD59_04665 [bacterium]|nr:hypothetical protein [bacterium]
MKYDKELEQEYYEILGITPDATPEEILTAKDKLNKTLFSAGTSTKNIRVWNAVSRWIDTLPALHYTINEETREILCKELGLTFDASDSQIYSALQEAKEKKGRENITNWNKLIRNGYFSYSHIVKRLEETEKKCK